jgi:hypothetical protein
MDSVMKTFELKFKATNGEVKRGLAECRGTNADGAGVRFLAWWERNMHGTYGAAQVTSIVEISNRESCQTRVIEWEN